MINLYSPMSGMDPGIGYCLYKIFDWPLIGGGYVNEKYVKVGDGHFNRWVMLVTNPSCTHYIHGHVTTTVISEYYSHIIV